MDLCLAVSGQSSLHEALANMFLMSEQLNQNNKYFCDGCKKLVDATKVRACCDALSFLIVIHHFCIGGGLTLCENCKMYAVVERSRQTPASNIDSVFTTLRL